MKESIRNIFDKNILLLGDLDKAVYYFREQQYDKALEILADIVDLIKCLVEEFLSDRNYFSQVSRESVYVMLSGILEAKRNGDYVLLADLLELQLTSFLIEVQELIISKDEILPDVDQYHRNISLMEQGEDISDAMKIPVNPSDLLDLGYRVEFTSCGLMTLAAENNGATFYFHTNNRIQSEAFLLARHWYEKDVKKYIIYGFGMGYHIEELHGLSPEAEIEVYEADRNVLHLACAFANPMELLKSESIHIVYDPKLQKLRDKILLLKPDEAFYVHYPSYKNFRDTEDKKLLENAIPWSKSIESC